MKFNPMALVVLVGFFALLAVAMSSNGGTWFRVGEVASTVVIACGVAGLLGHRGVRAR
jgi:hypothetical protein